jgi:hypothetical protein
VSFASRYHDGDTVYVGRYVPDSRHRGAQSDPHDLAVVVFDKAVPRLTPARLPAAGDTPCRSTNVDYRLDTLPAREFLGQFVTLP